MRCQLTNFLKAFFYTIEFEAIITQHRSQIRREFYLQLFQKTTVPAVYV